MREEALALGLYLLNSAEKPGCRVVSDTIHEVGGTTVVLVTVPDWQRSRRRSNKQ
jgi:hypothetical protein